MTDKQIILNGVDVLKEKINICFILLLNKLETSETIEQTIYEHLDVFVEEWNKQLKRKEGIINILEQECTEKMDIITTLGNKLKAKEQEYEKLLEFNNSLVEEHKTIGNDLYKEIEEYRKKLQAKEQECEELKKVNRHIEHNRNQKADKLMRIEKLITACSTGYTDDFTQSILAILLEAELTEE